MADQGDIVFVYVTMPSLDAARDMAAAVVEDHLAACANILPAMQSIYRWQGKIEQAEESVLIFKTTSAHVTALESRILSLHPYDVPCIVALPVAAGHAPYLQWIAVETNVPE